MNTIKILDVVAQTTPVQVQPLATPPRNNPPQAVPALGDGATSDAVGQDTQKPQRHAEAAAAQAERKRPAPKAPPSTLNREVGLVGDTFQVFVDLVSPAVQSQRFRIFGPPDNQTPLPPLETNDPASAHAAYADAPAQPPVLKTDV